MNEFLAPLQYRLRMDDGNVLVITLEIEEVDEIESVDPTSLGDALLSFLGRGNRKNEPLTLRSGRPAPRKKIIRPVEEDADAWLARTSKDALRRMP